MIENQSASNKYRKGSEIKNSGIYDTHQERLSKEKAKKIQHIPIKQQQNTYNSGDQSFLKLKLKKTPVSSSTAKQNDRKMQIPLNDVFSTSEIGLDDQLGEITFEKKGRQINKQKPIPDVHMKDLNLIMKAEKYHNQIKSPLIYEEDDDYNAVGNQFKDNQIDYKTQYIEDEYQETDIAGEMKVPTFLSRGSLEPNDNSQFYMTQMINKSRQAPLNATQLSNLSNQKNSVVGQSIKQSKSQLKGSNSKKSVQSLVNRSQVIKNSYKRKQISPISNNLSNNRKQERTILDKYMNLNEFGSYGFSQKNPNLRKKIQNNNVSSILNNNLEMLNSTAPLNMTQLNNMYEEGQFIEQGMTDVVTSTQNLRRINSRDSWRDQTHQLDKTSSYYNGLKGVQNQANITGNTTQNTVTPLKEQQKKKLLIKNILNQDGFSQDKNKKYFLNLTLQQLIQQQKLGNKIQQDYPSKIMDSSFDAKKQFKNQKRLNKTLDNFKDDNQNNTITNVNNNLNVANDNSNLRSFINNFILGSQGSLQFQYNKQPSRQKQSTSFMSNKLSSTMKIQDFNNTQQIFESKVSNPTKKSKSSLKSTQNLNFQDENKGNNAQSIPKKYSALSQYSMNNGVTYQNQNNNNMNIAGKSRKIINTKNAIHINLSKPSSQTKHKRQTSQEKTTMQQILNFYQDENISNLIGSEIKSKTFANNPKDQQNNIQLNTNSFGNIYSQTQMKHKANTNLNQYLQNSRFTKTNQAPTQNKIDSNKGLANSFMNIVGDKFNHTMLNINLNNLTEMKNYENFETNQNVEHYQTGGTQADYKSSNTIVTKNHIQFHKHRDRDLIQSAILQNNNYITEQEVRKNPYQNKPKQSKLKKEQVKDLQNKTQPIPKHILEMAQAEAVNFSTGTSIIGMKQNSQQSIKSKSKSRKQYNQKGIRVEEIQLQGNNNDNYQFTQNPKQREDNPSQIYNNKNTVILDENMEQVKDSLETQENEQLSKLDRFNLGKQIGQGAYAVVRVATAKKDNQKFAIKIYDKSKLTDTNRQRSVRREIKLLQKMNHMNIVKIFEAFETDDHVYLVMEYVGGGNLYTYLKQHKHSRLEEEEAKRIFKQLLTALSYCHRKSIAHRDIKLENILLDEDRNVKLIDFGFSTCIPNDKKIKMFCGTPSYMAPEIVMKLEYAGPPADIWASGVLLYALMNGKFPFRGDTDKDLYRRIQRGTFEIHNSSVTPQFIAFLARMINTNADIRPVAEDLLQDQWFKINSNEQIFENEQQKLAYMNDQKRIFKAKILAKIPVEKKQNTICLLSAETKPVGQRSSGQHNINLGQINSNNFSNNQQSNFKQNINLQDQSDYGTQSYNVMRKLNQEAYQAYYNTSGGIYGQQPSNNVQNPYYNNYFTQNTNGYINLQPQQQQQQFQAQNINQQQPNNQGYQNGITNQMNSNNGNPQFRQSPSKQGININTNPSFFPVNFQQQPPNQIGTPQVFGSPTGFQCTAGLINNNFNIVNNITQVTCLPLDLKQHHDIRQHSNPSSGQQTNKAYDSKNEIQSSKKIDSNNQEMFSQDLDEEVIESITYLGYHRSHVVSQLEQDSSQISHLYRKIKDEKMSMTQNRPLSLQPHSRRPNAYQNLMSNNYNNNNNHNNGIFPPNFIPSINDSLKIPCEGDMISDYHHVYSDNQNGVKLLNCNS